MAKDLFGEEIIEDELLRDKFIEPPFSILDTKQGSWQARKRKWINKGIKSELGREDSLTLNGSAASIDFYRVKEGTANNSIIQGTSIFDPALCEVIYHWFVPQGGQILDPFAGGCVRGIVANYLGFKYTGIDLRAEQIESNRIQALDILDITNQPQWYVGDSNIILERFTTKFDFIFSCPPYSNLEKYSNLPEDLSNMNYDDFLIAYESVINKSCMLLKSNCFACFVVGEVRDKNGYYIGFVPDTIKAFEKCGLKFYNEAILLNQVASGSMRAANNMKYKKLVKVHQNVLIFYKP